ncbi:RNA polymerase recycling motor HelD [Companilactobacillus alimentarius]|uniref:ATP-dependent DNA helicase n=1 Tax=Companilactobacillus alimentarius DSM 20249 TaxID=1423720 RepID=A0A2K9HPD4_9LACO|nr:RNA polymerase recycling motor HelD [Companilactobacillus alimentarius]AUI72283.1 ATP-dependent DNA helicase [Companilactobacillus alimentarius DSM 20249]KRK77492.1 DNA helicase superfamily protein I [Companilactobacillus alimentarius DSM 20249]MDT6952858.1 RNA polymerase recycling motor HelD [Companilactobacillus alimentarius]GEO45509.1 DNA helicase [Companilactobacillus alimentarius]
MTDKSKINELDEKKIEQAHLDDVVEKIKKSEDQLQEHMNVAEEDLKVINNAFDDIHLGMDGDSISMDAALSIHQQQQMLDERNNSWQQSKQRYGILKKLEKNPFFARLDFQEKGEPREETVYIGLSSFTDKNDHFLVYDWRAPISSIYYDGKLGKVTYMTPDGEQEVNLFLKRQFLVEDGKIKAYFDTQETIGDQMLLEVLDGKSSTHMKGIVKTIQKEQNKIIRDTTSKLLFVQGAAGSGKTSAILQRIAYLLYRYRGTLTSSQVVMFSPNSLFNDYIKDVLPEMGEQNMVQMTYKQFLARRLPNLSVESLSQQFETVVDTANKNISKFVSDIEFFNILTNYSKLLDQSGMAFKNIKFQGKVFIPKEKIQEIYYSYGPQYNLGNRLDATVDRLIKMLHRKMGAEMRSNWVSERIENLDKEQLQALYNAADQEFKNGDEEKKFLARKIVAVTMQGVYKYIKHLRFLNVAGNYLNFLKAVPKIVDLEQRGITKEQWEEYTTNFVKSFNSKQISMNNLSPYLYLYDLVTGKHGELDMKFVFIDEIQDYTPFQLAYMKYKFPRARYTMLGDLNQSIFTKKNSQTLLSEAQSLFEADETRVVQLVHSYRSTKQITDFTKAILTNGQKIEPFNREGDLPNLFMADSESESLKQVMTQLKVNDKRKFTTAIIAKTLEDADHLHELLEEKGVKSTLIRSENQRLATGTIVLPSFLAKGLEFDAVIMWDASKDKFDEDEQQLVYTIASRAMHKLTIASIGELSQLLQRVPEKFYTREK